MVVIVNLVVDVIEPRRSAVDYVNDWVDDYDDDYAGRALTSSNAHNADLFRPSGCKRLAFLQLSLREGNRCAAVVT